MPYSKYPLSSSALLSLLASGVFLSASFVFIVGRSSAKEADHAKTSKPSDSALNLKGQVTRAYGKLPLSFEPNLGQADRRVRFSARGQGYGLFLTSDETVVALRSASDITESNAGRPLPRNSKVLRMKLLGADQRPDIRGLDELPGKHNYFVGNDSRKWLTDIPAYSKVRYRNVYPGIDVVYHGQQGQLEYDFVIAPGRSPARIKMAFKGMESIHLEPDETLVLHTSAGDVRQPKPIAYQEINGQRREVAARYLVKGNEVSFKIGTYDKKETLIIDPVIVYSTFLGGASTEQGLGIAVDAQGNAYLTGRTNSVDFPLAGALQSVKDGFSDAFVAKLNPSGTALVYSTYLGGNGSDVGNAIAVDSQGSAYVVGSTFSTNFPHTPGVFQDTKDAFVDAFVSKLSPSGSSLTYSTFLGGNNSDNGYGISVSTDGSAYVVGRTDSTRFRTLPFPTPRNGSPVYKSTNGAALWAPGASGLSSSVVNGFGLDPVNANKLYAATTTGVFKSTDSGSNWNLTGTARPSTAPTSPSVIVVDSSNPNVIYAGGIPEGVHKSIDGGNLYDEKNNGLSALVNSLAIDPNAPTTLYAATLEGVYKTTNGGDTWQEMNNGLGQFTAVNEIVIDPTSTTVVYIGTERGMFKSTNGGTLWTSINSGPLSESAYVTALAIDPLNPSTLYIGGFGFSTGGEVLKTTNGGMTWTAIGIGLNFFLINDLNVDPITPGTIYAATGGAGIYKSINGGTNWTGSNTGLANLIVNDVAFNHSNPAIVHAGTNIGGDAFAVKLNPSGSALDYLNNFGGSENEEARGVALDPDGNSYVVGSTDSVNFPLVNALQPFGGFSDAFVAKLNTSGTAFTYSTYIGGNGFDQGRAIAVRSGRAFVVGDTTSSNFPLLNAIKSTLGPFDTDAFVSRLNTSGNGLEYSTYLGGNTRDQGLGVSVASDGSTLVTGLTSSLDFPTLGGLQPNPGGGDDAFVTKLNPAGTALVYSTYLGGSNSDQGSGIATDSSGNAYVVGNTLSANFPIVAAFQPTIRGGFDAFVAKLGPGVEVAVTMTDSPDPVAFGSDLTYTINMVNSGELPATNVTLNDTLPAGSTFVSAASTRGTCSGTGPVNCAIGTLNGTEMATVTMVIKPPALRRITNTASVSLTETDPVTSNNTASVDTLVDFADLSVVKKAPHTLVAPGANLTYTLNVRNLGGIDAQSVTVSDNLPSGLTFVRCSATTVGVCGGAGNNVSVTFPTLAVGGSEAITITANVSGSTAAGTIIANTASVSATLPDPDQQNNTSTASVTVVTTPVVTKSNGRIAFAADRFTPVSGPSGIYTINPDGTDEVLFPNIPLNAGRPSWSPDGSRLAFHYRNHATSSPVNEISVIKTDGSGLLKIAEKASDFNQRITWSPSGAHVAFIGEGDGQHPETFRAVFIAHTDGSGAYRLPISPTLLKSVDWSPDGSKFAYTTDSELFVMNADGSGQTQLTTSPTGTRQTSDSHARWSPDGSKIMFTRSSNNGADLYSIHPDGSGITRLLNINQTAEGSWSPDGTKVLFTQANEILTIDAIGAQQRLTNNIDYEFSPDWQPIANASPTPTPTPIATFTISGKVTDPPGGGPGGALMKLSGARTGLIGTNADGTYTFVNLPQGGKYTVTPTSAYSRFVPGSRTVENLQQNETGLDFVSTPVIITISGRMTDTLGNGLGGQGVSLLRFGSRRDTTTDAQGNYSFANVFPGDGYSLLPQSVVFSFDPIHALLPPVFDSMTVNVVGAPASGVRSISGRITDINSNGSVSGMVVTLSGGRQAVAKTNEGGNFSFNNLPTGGEYTITPSAAGGLVFVPSQRTFNNLTMDQFGGFSATIAQPNVHFSAGSFTVGEGAHSVEINVTRAGDLSAEGEVDYQTSDLTGSERTDYTASFGTLRFAPGEASRSFTVFVTDDVLVEGERLFRVTLSNGSGVIVGSPATATVRITEDESAPSLENPVDDASFFVRQHYADFLNRAPDASGLDFWTNQITSCGADTQCRELRRINVSAAFFLSIEFQQTGYLVYRLHHAAFNTGEKLRLKPFLSDTQEIGRGVAVGVGNWEELLEANKQSFINDFVLRQEFIRVYPLSMGPSQFVDMLNSNTGGALTAPERDALVADLGAGLNTRAQVLRAVAENDEFGRRQSNRAFVLMQYFGYLRREPDDPPDSDFAGWQFWLNKLDEFNGNFVNAEMVKAFITSGEYTHRFGR